MPKVEPEPLPWRRVYLETKLLQLVKAWWPEHENFRRTAWLEVKKVIDDAASEALREDWRKQEKQRARMRAVLAAEIKRSRLKLSMAKPRRPGRPAPSKRLQLNKTDRKALTIQEFEAKHGAAPSTTPSGGRNTRR